MKRPERGEAQPGQRRLTRAGRGAKKLWAEDRFMFMIVPYSTDAPIYHFPKATVGVIATNVAVHLAWCLASPEAAEPFAMKLGVGLHPMQWLTHNFLHADFLHLFFNMVFLWSYGIIVEGKIGWLPFLLNYVLIGTIHGAVIQAAYLHAPEPSYVVGASAIIFGLMAMCMIWAPVNDLSCFYLIFVGFRIITNTFEVPIYAFAILQLTLEGLAVLLQFLIKGDPMSSGLLHVSGAFWGLIAGIVLVQAHLVDCEDWDVFSLIRKRRALREAWKARAARLELSKTNEMLPRAMRPEEDRARPWPTQRPEKLLLEIHRSIELNDSLAVQAAYEKWLVAVQKRPPREALVGLIKAMQGKKQWDLLVPPMRAFCQLYPENSEKVRLKLASLLIRRFERPTEGLRLLQQISAESLDPDLKQLRHKLLKESEQMIEDGVLELEEDD
jgi:membrane associated rhomboid family serine protease